MSPKLNRGFLPLILIMIVGIIPNGVVCQNEYQNCSQPFECGSLREIGYPFYGGSRPASCGYPGFELNCQNGVPLINSSSIVYRVLAIDNQTQTVRVARNDLWGTLCDPLLQNTTLNSSFYSFYPPANDQEITLVYRCTVGQMPSIPLPGQFPCTGNSNGLLNGIAFFFLRDLSLLAGVVTCVGPRITVRVNQSAAEELAVAANTNNSATMPILLQTSLESGFSIQWSADNQNCESCVQSGGLCGFNQTSSSFACHCTNATFPSTCTNTNLRGSGNGLSDLQKYVITGVSLGVLGLVISFIVIFCVTRQCRLRYVDQESNNQNVEKFLLAHGSLAPKRYSYNEIKKMTNSFKDKLGQGGYGIVYKGELPDGQLVAVKVLTEIHENAEEFINEVASISRTSHVNIVNLLGFCYQSKKRALVYEFIPNKSLDKFIYKRGLTDSECSTTRKTLIDNALKTTVLYLPVVYIVIDTG